MADVADMLSSLTTILTGGATGIVGSAIGAATNYITNKQQMAMRTQEADIEERKLRVQAELGIQAAKTAGDIDLAKGGQDLLKASYAQDASYGPVSIFMADILRMFRPFLTGFLIWSTWQMYMANSGSPELQAEIADTLLYCTVTAVTWWFGDRAREYLNKRNA